MPKARTVTGRLPAVIVAALALALALTAWLGAVAAMAHAGHCAGREADAAGAPEMARQSDVIERGDEGAVAAALASPPAAAGWPPADARPRAADAESGAAVAWTGSSPERSGAPCTCGGPCGHCGAMWCCGALAASDPGLTDRTPRALTHPAAPDAPVLGRAVDPLPRPPNALLPA